MALRLDVMLLPCYFVQFILSTGLIRTTGSLAVYSAESERASVRQTAGGDIGIGYIG